MHTFIRFFKYNDINSLTNSDNFQKKVPTQQNNIIIL